MISLTDNKLHLSLSSASATVYLYGATLASWKTGTKERLFLSSKAILDGTKPIRGGIPLVFPQFGPGQLPQHGFARNSMWKYASSEENDTMVKCTLTLEDSPETMKVWPHKFTLEYVISLTADTLECRLKINTDAEYTCLLHTYFCVAALDVKISGLGDCFVDKLSNQIVTSGDTRISCEVDRIYTKPTGTYRVDDVEIVSNSKDVVLWNPWVEKSKKMSDFGDEEYKEMVCVEVGNVSEKVKGSSELYQKMRIVK